MRIILEQEEILVAVEQYARKIVELRGSDTIRVVKNDVGGYVVIINEEKNKER